MENLAVERWKQLSALYEQADELPPEALPGWLDELRARGHPLVDELAKMLQARDRVAADAFMDTLPPLGPAPAGPAGGLAAGDRVGPWRLVQPLGRGGMAEVWLAQRDDGSYFRRVALKLLDRHVAAGHRDTFVARFERERDILSTLHHPHIAAMFDAGVTESGQPWLALEYVEGEPLVAACDRQAIGLRRRVELFLQVLQAVQHAHANLVVHRDLKPANILLTGEGSVKLLDFGIAKLAEAEGEALAETELTRLDGRPLTLAYAAPEQLLGLPLTTACDVYALGVVLYELVCGLRPYELKAETPAQIELAILEVEPRAPSRRDMTADAAAARRSTPAHLRRQIAPDLDAIVLRALAKEPAQRYGSVESLRADLQRWLDGEPVGARVPSAWYRTRKFAARHRVGVALGALSVSGLIGLSVTAFLFALQARDESARAVAARDFMIDIFRNADPEKARGASITAGEMLDAGRRQIGDKLRGQPELQIDLLTAIVGIQRDMSEWGKADGSTQELLQLLVQAGRSREAALVTLDRAEGFVYQGHHSKAGQLLDRFSATEAKRLAADPAVAARFAQVSGWVENARGNWAEAERQFEKALAGFSALHGADSVAALAVRRALAMLATDRRDHARALALSDDIAARASRMPGLLPVDKVSIDQERLNAHQGAGRFADVWLLSVRAIEQCGRLIGPHTVECRTMTRLRALAALRLGRSEELASSDLAILRGAADDDASPSFSVMAQQALVRVLAERSDGSVEAQLRSQRLAARLDRLTEEQVPARVLWVARACLAESYLRLREPGKALAAAEAAAGMDSLRSMPEVQAMFGVTAALAALQLGQVEQARARIDAAMALLATTPIAHEPMGLLLSMNQATVLAAQGRHAEASALISAALGPLREALGDDSPTFAKLLTLSDRLRAGVATGKATPNVWPYFL